MSLTPVLDTITTKIVGDIQLELVIKWTLKDLFPCLTEDVKYYESTSFSFAGHFWRLRLHPNGESDESEGYISLYLRRNSFGPAIEIEYTLGIETQDGEIDSGRNLVTRIFDVANCGRGYRKFLARSELLERKSELLPSNVLTVVCSIKCQKIAVDETNEKLLKDLKELMLSGDHADTTIKLKDEEFRFHRSILTCRNPFFRAMFECEMKEKATGQVSIDECEPDIFRSFVHFVYTGKLDKMSVENVCELYYIADKYQDDQLKNECLHFMLNAMSLDSFCDFLDFALKNDEKKLLKRATEFFCKETKTIIKSVKWQSFIKEHPMQANELFIKTFEH